MLEYFPPDNLNFIYNIHSVKQMLFKSVEEIQTLDFI